MSVIAATGKSWNELSTQSRGADTRIEMTVPEILNALRPHTGKFPREALEAAVEQREVVIPELLRVLEAAAQNPAGFAESKNQLPWFAVYLLAQFREKSAYRVIVKLVSAPGELSFDLLGDTVTGGLHRILASVYDGDPAPLQGLVENREANEYARWAAVDTLLTLENTGQMRRDEVVEYLRSLFHGKLERAASCVWDGLLGAVADLPAPELLEDARQADREDFALEGVISDQELEGSMADPNLSWREDFTLITDTISELSGWACFADDDHGWDYAYYGDEDEDADLDASLHNPMDMPPPYEPAGSYETPEPYVRGEPKIGRNDPCPCGSRKKYKKCCGKG